MVHWSAARRLSHSASKVAIPALYSVPFHSPLRLGGHHPVPVEMPGPERGVGAGPADVSKHPEPGAAPAAVRDRHRLLDDGDQDVEDVGGVERIGADHRLGGRQVAPAGEHRQAVEDQPLVVGQELRGPLGGGP